VSSIDASTTHEGMCRNLHRQQQQQQQQLLHTHNSVQEPLRQSNLPKKKKEVMEMNF
jgi:hypothetical protein